MNKTTKNFSPVITEEIFETVVLLALQNPKENYILVEGSTDYALFSKFIDEEKILFFDNEQTKNSKKTILSTINSVNKESETICSRLIAVVDRDFDTLQKNPRKIPKNVFYCDYHDLDAQIFFSEAFKNFFRIYSFEPWKLNINSIREKITQIGFQYGIIKLIFHNLFISIRELEPKFPCIEDLIDHQTIRILSEKINEYLSNILNTSDYERYQKKLKRYEQSEKIDEKLVPSGHDLIRILCVFVLYSIFPIRMKNLTKKEKMGYKRDLYLFTRKVENIFRSNYDFNSFLESNLCNDLVFFEESYKVRILKYKHKS